jgi:hypothetical protein
MSDPKCADIIPEDIRQTEDYLSPMLEVVNGQASDDEREEAIQMLDEFAIGQEELKVLRLTLSYGGPSSWIDIMYNNGEIDRIAYHYQDWFDGAVKLIGKDSPIWQYAEQQLETHILLST